MFELDFGYFWRFSSKHKDGVIFLENNNVKFSCISPPKKIDIKISPLHELRTFKKLK